MGLQALALGIAIGAAIVLTGGAAAVVIIAACAISVAALYKMAHDCDATLDREWQKPHDKVSFNKEKAILNRSYLDCPKGPGKITIIMDPVIAQKAADFISNNNIKKAMMQQMGSQLVMGVITGVTAGTSVIAVGVTGALTLALYTPSEAFGDTDFGSNNEGTTSTISAVGSDAVSAGIGVAITKATGGAITEVGGTIINSNVGNAVGGLVQYGAGSAMGNVSRSFEGAIRNFIGHRGLKADNYSGYKGIAGFVANIAIGTFADKYENGLADETSERARILNISDAKNGINVIAINS